MMVNWKKFLRPRVLARRRFARVADLLGFPAEIPVVDEKGRSHDTSA